jgi:type IV secretion system protein VirD4
MPAQRRAQSSSADTDLGTTLLLTVVFGVAGLGAVLWLGGVAASLLTGHGAPHAAAISGLRTLANPGHPSRGWQAPMPGPVAYWTITACLIAAIGAIAVLLALWWHHHSTRLHADVHGSPGLATRAEVRATASGKALLRRADIIRPSLQRPHPSDVGYRLGSSRGIEVWTSVEDSLVILGPPRSGKGLHLVTPMILDAPGALITTSTRPDNVAVTRAAREQVGPVAVFDPQCLAPGVTATTKWSPIRGCDQPQTAMIRARALAAESSEHVDNRGFWQAQTESALRAFLHAAALDGRGAAELYRWSLDPAAAGEAVRILNASTLAAPGWADALDALVNGDPRTRDNSWAGIRVALSSLADPRVLAAVTPSPDLEFDPSEFLTNDGTLYLLGTASGVGAAANLVAALIEDVVDVARRAAAASPSVRLDPPLALILDEAANYALPSLPSLISEGGGTGITTVAVLQSLAQARARWGEHEGAAIWDAASVKVILGGGSNARDLHDLSALIGERDEETQSFSSDGRGVRTRTTNTRRVPVLETGRLRTLPFGTGVLLLRTAAPIMLDLQPWTSRR